MIRADLLDLGCQRRMEREEILFDIPMLRWLVRRNGSLEISERMKRVSQSERETMEQIKRQKKLTIPLFSNLRAAIANHNAARRVAPFLAVILAALASSSAEAGSSVYSTPHH